MSETLIRESSELIHGDGRTVVVQLAKWNEPRTVSDDGQTTYREAFEPGGLELAERVRVVDQHHGDTIGHADVSSYRADPEPTVDLHIAETQRGDDVLALIRNGTIEGVSVEFRPSTTDRIVDGIMRRSNALVHGIAFAFRPSHTAPILATREATETGETETMSEQNTDPAGITADDLATFGDELKREMIEHMQVPAVSGPADPYEDLRKFRSLQEFADARYEGSIDASLHRALADQITPNNPGVVPPGWVREVKGIVDTVRGCVQAFGGARSLPESGMDVNWPYFDQPLSTLVGEQLTEKSEILSVQLDILRGTSPIRTFAGGSDLSYQLIRRSDPSYRDAYLRIMTQAYAYATEGAFAADLETATGDNTYIVAAWDAVTTQVYLDHLFKASMDVESATGAPASVAVCGSNAYAGIGTLGIGTGTESVLPPQYGNQTPVVGQADAGTLAVNISNVPHVHCEQLDPNQVIVSNASAADFMEDGPLTISAEDVEKLGQNVAVFGMVASAIYTPAALVGIGPAPTP